jgi:peptide-methionine (S)-S-oxide reductase
MNSRLAAVCALICLATLRGAIGAEAMVKIPAFDGQAAEAAGMQTAVVAGGCFWGVQGVYQHLKGVQRAESGYAGGSAGNAQYEIVGTGQTGHAEAVKITFDPRVVSYARILQVYFSVAHDPTQLNRQGPDHGTQYRSTIFPMDAEQARIAKEYIAQLDKTRVFPKAIATTIEPDRKFYPAEDYHQDYLTLNPRNSYIAINDMPKIDGLKRIFPDEYRAQPALIHAAR